MARKSKTIRMRLPGRTSGSSREGCAGRSCYWWPVCYNGAMEELIKAKKEHIPVMTPALCAAITNRYHLSLLPARRLSGGEECEIWLATSDDGPFIVRISPGQRSLAQLGWTHTLMLSLYSLFPVVVAPLRAIDGSTLFLYNG